MVYDPLKNYGSDQVGLSDNQFPAMPRSVMGLGTQQALDNLLPAGIFLPYAGAISTIPSGWLLCNGQAVSRQSYSRLFTAIGTAYGSADASLFNVPDLRERVPVGVSAGSAEFGTLGAVAGSKSTEAHQHTIVNSFTKLEGGGGAFAGAAAQSTSSFGGTGSGNIQPSVAANYIIKY